MNWKTIQRWSMQLAAALLLCGLPSWSQVITTATINGTVTDSTGAIVPGTAVEILDQQTKVLVKTVTNGDGAFTAAGLNVGVYRVTFHNVGFQGYSVSGIELHPATVATVNGILRAGEVSSVVDVQASAVTVELSTPELSSEVSAEQAGTLPLNGRNYQSLSALMPGVTNVAPGKALNQGGFTTTNVMSVNGMSISGTMYYVDGIWDMDTGDMTQETITPNPDTIQEVRVLKNNYGVQYSLNGANVLLLQTKAGTSQFHGSAFEYLRNDDLNARNYFSTVNLPYKQNIYGFTLGGPFFIPKVFNTAKNRIFFYWSEQWVRQRVSQSPLRGQVPTLDERNGLFPSTRVIKNPSTGQPFPQTAAGEYIVPQQPVSVALANAVIPLPNYSSSTSPSLNYENTDPLVNSQRDDMVKADVVISPRLHLMAEMLHSASVVTYPNESILGSPLSTIKSTRNTPNYLAQFQLTQILSPNMVNTTAIAMNRYITQLNDIGIAHQSQVPGYSQTLPYAPAVAANFLPEFTFSQGYALFGIALNVPQPAATDLEDTVTDDWSMLKGKHYFQAGFQQVFGTKRQTSFEQANGLFNFTGARSGDAMADFYLGDAATFAQGNNRPRYYLHFVISSPYIQDRWQLTHRLTLNAGLRYIFAPTVHSQNQFESAFVPANYDPAKAPIVNNNGTITATPTYDPLNGLVINGENGIPINFSNAHRNYFAPAAGFAYDLFGNGLTSLRGGFGYTIYNNFFTTCGQSCDTNPPFVQSITLVNPNFPNPVGATQAPSGAPTISSEEIANMRDASVESYSLSLEHQFRGSYFASIAGAGDIARHLPETRNLNQPLPDGQYDYNPVINAGTSYTYLYGPYLGYGAINQSTFAAYANWNALELNLRHPMKHNFFLSLAYTWQHGLSESRTNNMFALSAVQDIYHPHLNYGNSNVNVPQIFTASVIYSEPRWGSERGLRNELLGEWQISDITTIQSGSSQEIGITTSTKGLATRPNQLTASVNGPKTINEWFNTGAFAAPAAGHFGNARPGAILGPGIILFDMALYKDFPTWHEQKLQFRAEAFNVFNHTNFNTVNTNYGAAAFGQVTGAADARVLEGVLRYEF